VSGLFWLERHASDLPTNDDWLSATESACLAALRFPKRRQDWKLGRWTAKHAAAAFLGLPQHPGALAEIEIRPAPSGAPELFIAGQPASISLSLSHSAATALSAVAAPETMIGCDLETVAPRDPAFLHDYFTPAEQAVVLSAPEPRRDRLITVLWSAKESVLKALRVGLRADTRTVSVCPVEALSSAPSAWMKFWAIADSGEPFRGWWRETSGLVRTFAMPRSAPFPAPNPLPNPDTQSVHREPAA